MPVPNPHRIDPPSTVAPSRVVSAAAPVAAASERRQRTIDPRFGGGSAGATCEGSAGRGSRQPGGPPASASPLPASQSRSDAVDHPAGDHDWLRLHAAELLDRIQAWASELDAREAQLNARLSLQEHRERRFRLQQQDVAEQLAQQQRSIERLHEQSLAQARRLAFRIDSEKS